MAGNQKVANRMRAAASLMRQRGLIVGAFAGWADAGRSSIFNPRAVTCHHTGASVDVDRILRDGRSDLPGPLANWALHMDGSWWLVGSGRANHAGVGWLPSSESYGIEATGPSPVTSSGVAAFPNYDAYVLGVACIVEAEGWTPKVVYAHKETCTPDGRKPDPAFGDPYPAPYRDMDRFRAQVNQAIQGEVQDMTEEQARQLDAIYQGLTVPGTTSPEQTVNILFNRVKAIEDALNVPGTTSAQQGFEILFARVRIIEKQVQLLVDALGAPVAEPPPAP
jgi:hypothetical protein